MPSPIQDGSVVTDEYNNGTKAITIGNQENRILLVGYGSYQGGGPSGMTYAGQALTKIVEMVGSFSEVCSIWGLLAPPVGTDNLIVSGLGNWSAFGALSLYNAKQSLSMKTGKVGGDSGEVVLNFATEYKNSWIVTAIEAEPVPTMTTPNGVLDWNWEGDVFQHAQGQHVDKASPGNVRLSASLSYGARWNICALEVRGISPEVNVKVNALRPRIFAPGLPR